MSVAAGPDAVDSGIVLVYDAANTNCYPGSGSSITDISNNGYVGTLLNSVGFSTANGGVLTFNGTNQQITNGFKPSGARSYFIWVKYNKITGLPNSFSLTGTQEINAYNYIGIYDGGTFYYYAGTTGNNLASVFLKAGNWYQQGFVLYSDGSRTLYLNGVSVGSEAGGVGNTATGTFSVGCVNSNHWVDGQIGMVQQFNRPLTASEVLQNYNATKARFTTPNLISNGLVLNLDAGNSTSYSGSGTTWTDISGWGSATGTLTNGPTYSSSYSGYIIFDGVNDYVDLGSPSALAVHNQTISVWFNTSTIAPQYQLLYGTNNYPKFYLANGALYGYQGPAATSSVISINTWYNAVMTCNSSGTSYYLNGAFVSSSTGISNSATPNTATIGKDPSSSGQYFTGNISAVQIYNRILTASEITQNFNALRWRYNI